MNTATNWEVKTGRITPWHRWSAKVLLALKVSGSTLPSVKLALSIPQSGCCFSFGTAKLPLPAGAVLQLWKKDPHATGTCPLCGGEVVATAFGGLMSIGGYIGICLACAQPLFRWIGGLGAVSMHVGPFLKDGPWHLAGARFGGAVEGDGRALAKALGLGDPPKATSSDAPVMKVGKHRMVLEDVGFEAGNPEG